jgi:purine-nucleoside phosphorylase
MIIDQTRIKETVDYIEAKIEIQPDIAIILGSGLGAVVDLLEGAVHIPYSDIPNFPVSTVKGHSGRLAFGTYAGKGIMVQEGRVHFYEGLGAEKVMYPLFVMKALGVTTLINTNAAGGINPDFSGGDLMLIQDHINFMSMNPLTGPNDDSVGPRFPDLAKAYNPDLNELAARVAEKNGIKLQTGILAATSGPTYESKAEIAMLGVIAIRLPGTKLEWDAEKMQFVNCPQANQLVNPPYRDGWTL